MELDFKEYFERYEALVKEVDALFAKFENEMPDLVHCEKGCSDCCYALFDLSLVEALYINAKFNERFKGMDRSRILGRADATDRQIYKLKHKLHKASRQGTSAKEILEQVARTRVRCPMLDDDESCEMYDCRPLTCRLYGVPTAIGGKGHTCAKSGFKAGEQYPTVHMDALQDRLLEISRDLAKSINSRFPELHEMLVPLSMAIFNDYSKQFLGVREKTEQPETVPAQPAPQGQTEIQPMSEACGGCDKDKSACQTCSENSFDITIPGYEKED